MIKPKFNLRNNPAYKEGSILGSTDVGTKIAPVPLTFTRASKGYVEKASGLTEMGSNLPRIDKDGNTLYEPQRTNLLLRSQEFDNAAWTKTNATITSNDSTSPDGTVNADKLIPNTTNANNHQVQSSLVSITSGNTYTLSVYAKANGYNFINLLLPSSTFGSNQIGTFDLINGIAKIDSGAPTVNIENVGNDYYKCSITATATATLSDAAFIRCNSTYSNNSFVGDGTSGVYIWQGQLEQGSYATSPIKTENSKVTRVADSSSLTDASVIIGDSEGTIYFEGSVFDIMPSSFGARISLSDGTSSNRITINFNTTGQFQFLSVVGGVVQANPLVSSFTTNTIYKIAVAYSSGSFTAYVNGSKLVDTTTNTFAEGTLTALRLDDGFSSNFFYGNVSDLTLYDKALTDAELQNLTTL